MIKLKITIGLVFIALLTLTFTSCEKDEGDTPDYVGTWINEEVDDSFEEPMTVITTLVLTESTFDMSMSVDWGDAVIQMAGMKGSLNVSGDQFTIEPNSVAMLNFDTFTLEWVNKGEEGWEEALAEMDMSESETATYRVEGNQLIITMEGEDQAFTRQ